ncbi:MAG: hypothetical protein EOP04_08585 [Proteobacteria bacterium]|nr:MAG: hypothetical protein EOP04_08585 [Pseudomonadota bacterium]
MKPAVLFLSEETLKEKTVVNNNVDTKYLQQAIWTVQEEQIHPALGSALYRRLMDAIEKKTLTEVEKQLLDDYITNAMVFFVMAELPLVLQYKFFNRNVAKQNIESAETASMSDIAYVINKYKSKAEFFVERMKRFLLQKNTEGLLLEYVQHDSKTDSLKAQRRSYRCPFVLGD